MSRLATAALLSAAYITGRTLGRVIYLLDAVWPMENPKERP